MLAKSALLVLQTMKWIAIWSIVVIGLVARASAQGQAISIVNASFDSDVLNCAAGQGCYDNSIPGWTIVGFGYTFKPSTGPGGIFPAGIPGGGQMSRRLAAASESAPEVPESSPKIWDLLR